MPDEANKEFTIQVQFSGVEQEILGNFKQQIDSVAKAITLINDTMKDQIKALEAIQKDIRSYNTGGGPGGGGGGTGGGGGGIAQNLAGKPHGDGSEMVRSMQDLTRALGQVSGGGAQSLFGARGLTQGWREWDQENSFEKSQFPGAGFTPQDAIRQALSLGGISQYRSIGSGSPITPSALQAMHLAREENPNENVWRAEDYIKDATGRQTGWRKPFAARLGHIQGMQEYLASLGNTPEEGVVRNPLADKLQAAQNIYPYFSKGGVFNPGTYGLGLGDIKGYSQNLGQMSRFGMQFGQSGSLNPFDSRNAEAYGSQFQARLQSWGGFNPMLSSGQAQEIIGHVAGMGYSGGTGEQMRNLMSDVTQHTNIGMGDQAAIIDKSFRWGFANLQQLAAFMKNDIPAAAQAARMNVGQFAAQLQQVSGGVASARGMNDFQAMGAISDMSTGTGMDPGTAAGLMSNSTFTMMAASLQARKTGKPFSLTALDENPAGMQLAGAAVFMKNMIGGDPNDIASLRIAKAHGDKRAAAKLDAMSNSLKVAHVTGAADSLGFGNINSLNQVEEWFSDKGRAATDEAAKTRKFGEQFEAQYEAGKSSYEQHHGNDGGHSFWHSSLLNLGDKSGSEKAGDKKAAAWAKAQGSPKDFIKRIQAFGKEMHWSDDALGRIIGHKTVWDSGIEGRGAHHEELGAGYDNKRLAKNYHAEMARQKKQDQDKKSKQISITLNAGPLLKGLFTASSGSQAVAGGTNIPGSSDAGGPLWTGAVDGG